MEINKYTDIIGVVATEDITEGRMVLLTSQSTSHDFGSRTDLPGIKLPDTAAESAVARYCAGFALDNRPAPLMTYPAYSYSMRKGGWDQAGNVPFSSTVYLTHPGNMSTPQVIASGNLSLAFDRGVFTATSGNFIYSANLLVPGTFLSVANTAEDGEDSAGKLKYSASEGVAVVEKFDSTNFTLTFRTL